MKLYSGVVTGSLSVQGNLTVTGTANLSSSNAISSSYANNANLLDGLDSTSFVFTSSFNTVSSSFSSRVANTEATSSALTTASSSFSTRVTATEATASNFIVVSSSLSTRVTNIESTSSALTTASSSFSTRVTNTESTASAYVASSSSLSTRVTATEATASAYVTTSGSFSTRIANTEATSSALTTASSSFSTRVTATEATASAYVTTSGSLSTRVTATEATASSLTTASGSFSSRVSTIESKYITTGSNSFNGSQTITGSLTATGTITAQTLVVQTVTSSIVYSSGSNQFGQNTGNTQSMTGSLQVTGSTHYLLGNVGIGTTSPGTKLQVNSTAGNYGITNTNGTVTIGTYIEASNTYASFGTSTNHPIGFFTNNNAPQMYINTSGNVGIGTTSPTDLIHAAAGTAAGLSLQATGTGGSTWRILSTDNAASIGGGNLGFNNGSYRMVITSGGEVLIGTTTDSGDYKLQVNGNEYIKLTQGAVQTWSNSGNSSVNIRTNTGYNSILAFTEEGVSDRWSIGTKSADSNLYFSTGDALGAVKLTLSSAGAATFTGNITVDKSSPNISINASSGTSGQYNINNGVGTLMWAMYSTTGGSNAQGNWLLYSAGKTGGAGDVLTITPAGAATFSSSVTATALYLGSLTNEQLMISGTGSRGIGVSTITSGDPYVRLYDNTTIKADIWWGRSGSYMGVNSLGAGSITAINPNGGNVGIGTTSPSEKMHVSVGAGSSAKFVLEEGGAQSVLWTTRNSSTNGDLRFQTMIGGTIATRVLIDYNGYFATTSNTALVNPPYTQGMSFGWNKSNGQGESMINWSNAGGGTSPDITFNYWNNSTLSERMRITSGGNVGIGCIAPGVSLVIAGTDALKLPTGTTAQRPTGATGMVRMNTSIGQPEWYDTTSSSWVSFASETGTCTYDIQYFVLGGGGGAGADRAGGGGAGGYRLACTTLISGTSYYAIVGAGGASNVYGVQGGRSSFNSIASIGGGAGGDGNTNPGTDGGSGGGGGNSGGGNVSGAAGAGTTGQGNSGGTGTYTAPGYGTGGGGGAGAAGANGTSTTSGNGGDGCQNTICGVSRYYAGGGGAGNYGGGTSGTGGQGGGGNGVYNGTAGSGAANSGGGGGSVGTGGTGGSGGSGIVIIRYCGNQRGTGGTVLSCNGHTIHIFSSSTMYLA